MVKTVTGSATVDAAGLWTIVYDVEVTNTGDGRATSTSRDSLDFGGGVVVQSVIAVTGDAGVTLNPGFDGPSDTLIADNVVDRRRHVADYTVTVTATDRHPVLGEGAGACDPEGTEAGGFLNTVTLTSATTGAVDTDFACAPFSTLTLVKNLSNNNGGTPRSPTSC